MALNSPSTTGSFCLTNPNVLRLCLCRVSLPNGAVGIPHLVEISSFKIHPVGGGGFNVVNLEPGGRVQQMIVVGAEIPIGIDANAIRIIETYDA